MFTSTKQRINLSPSEESFAMLKMLAKKDNLHITTKAMELLQMALELEEDRIWGEIAEERMSEIKREESELISHEDFWKEALS